jgi:hypothetical protein
MFQVWHKGSLRQQMSQRPFGIFVQHNAYTQKTTATIVISISEFKKARSYFFV